MRLLTLDEVLRLHALVVARTGGAPGVLDRSKLDAAVAQPAMTFGGDDLYPTLADKAAALAFSLCQAHAFMDGNKRTAHAAMEAFLLRNGHEVVAPVDEQERLFLDLASGLVARPVLAAWIQSHLVPFAP